MRYRTGFCFHSHDLFYTFNTRVLKIKKKICVQTYQNRTKKEFSVRVFIYCCYLILLDIIENNITFVLPLFNNKNAFLYAKPIMGDDFKRARQNGAFKDIDYIASNFTGYRITYEWDYKGGKKYKDVHIGGDLKERFLENINNGKVYY